MVRPASVLNLIPDKEQRAAGAASLTFTRVESFICERYTQNDSDYTIFYNVKSGRGPLRFELSIDPEGLNVPVTGELREGQLLIVKSEAFFCSFGAPRDGSSQAGSSQVLVMNVERPQ